ncbi:hypothetical protein PAXRUDRAFT_441586 [Paxillus rubicundulus Ve08.2h10]|uniref:Uncharacterized protein n=1 Tax=Paxillus rubicundulus Ve08.2h10 TaxID=930991 RepID=A0A0D0DQC8_9AGAM|nr:hypothetical protein PAXRUDRAFT_441586 [Paxillus rubicundulus Ve08.2h10]
MGSFVVAHRLVCGWKHPQGWIGGSMHRYGFPAPVLTLLCLGGLLSRCALQYSRSFSRTVCLRRILRRFDQHSALVITDCSEMPILQLSQIQGQQASKSPNSSSINSSSETHGTSAKKVDTSGCYRAAWRTVAYV